jgi:hypothetical protein
MVGLVAVAVAVPEVQQTHFLVMEDLVAAVAVGMVVKAVLLAVAVVEARLLVVVLLEGMLVVVVVLAGLAAQD